MSTNNRPIPIPPDLALLLFGAALALSACDDGDELASSLAVVEVSDDGSAERSSELEPRT